MFAEIKKRGVFYCGDVTCSLAPEIWRGSDGDKRGLCAKHALSIGWIDKMPERVQDAQSPQNNKSFLTRLLDASKSGNMDSVLDGLFPSHLPAPHWSEFREYPF